MICIDPLLKSEMKLFSSVTSFTLGWLLLVVWLRILVYKQLLV